MTHKGGFDGSIPGSCNLFSVSSTAGRSTLLVRTSRIALDEHPVRQIDCMSHLDYYRITDCCDWAFGTKEWNAETTVLTCLALL
jgi:hypothetical protein